MRVIRILGSSIVVLGLVATSVALAPAAGASPDGEAAKTALRHPHNAGPHPGDAQTTIRGVTPEIQVFGGSRLGVSVREVEQDDVTKLKLAGPAGAVIEDVVKDSAASRAGLQAGDVIVEFDGERVRSAGQLQRLVRETPAGRAVKVVVMRNGQKTTMEVTLDEGPTGVAALVRDKAQLLAESEAFKRMNEELRLRMDRLGEELKFELTPLIPRQARLGVTLQELTPQLAEYFGVKDGVLVTSVSENSAAAQAGIKAGDVITAVNDRTVARAADISREVVRSAGREITLKVVRDKKEQTLKARIPDERRPVRRTIRTRVTANASRP